MITTDFALGSPCWIDLGVPDSATAKSFYGAVLGWTFQPFGSGEEEFGSFQVDGKTVAALGPLTEEGARSAWMIYFRTADAEAAARAVREAGGTVRVEPFDIDDYGRMAQFSDPQGGQFAVWQPGKSPGLEAVDEPGSLMWVELYTTDAAAAKGFYGGLLGWDFQDMPMPGDGGTYTLLGPAGAGQERQHGGLMEMPAADLTPTGGRPYWHPVFHTTDADAALAKVTEHGGSVQMGPADMEGVGRLAVCTDPFGADFVLLKPVDM
ncbi:VOC family protein [Streptomyces sp. JJ36]|uniref:VOC family protein n=1 Tax=Streptomyces sp. JJ36 TaxID=2736645 RepID=UPI001F210ABC|nr:VOC family protein [Streptomyces sp. JJ36]MCF6522643.1 VOC family protein [Streptomyces sp. JJ36]